MKESKGQKIRRKALRNLTDIARQREMERALSDLESKFATWRSGELSCFALNDVIHEFHDGTSRDIWKRYQFLGSVPKVGVLQSTDGSERELNTASDPQPSFPVLLPFSG